MTFCINYFSISLYIFRNQAYKLDMERENTEKINSKERGEYQHKIIVPCDWTFETMVIIVYDSFLENQCLRLIGFHCYNQPLTKV